MCSQCPFFRADFPLLRDAQKLVLMESIDIERLEFWGFVWRFVRVGWWVGFYVCFSFGGSIDQVFSCFLYLYKIIIHSEHTNRRWNNETGSKMRVGPQTFGHPNTHRISASSCHQKSLGTQSIRKSLRSTSSKSNIPRPSA